MKQGTKLLLLAGGGLAAYYFFIAKPKQDIDTAFAGGAGAVSAIPSAVGDSLSGLWNGLFGLLGNLTNFPPNVVGQPNITPKTDNESKRIIDALTARNAAVSTWQAAGGSVTSSGAFVMPQPVAQVSGLTVQQPAITNILQALAGQGQPAALNTVTTAADLARVQATRATEASIKAAEPAGSTVFSHRVQAGVDIYGVRSPSGAVSYIRR